MAYTGNAANNIGGSTIHKVLKKHKHQGGRSTIHARDERFSHLAQVHTIILDEVSMLGAGMMDELHQAFCEARSNQLPFGGITCIFLGDLLQHLPLEGRPPYLSPQC